MTRILLASVITICTAVWAAPAAACGMYIRPHYQKPKDTSQMLMVRARMFEKQGETRSALKLFERIMHDDMARKGRRSSAALAASRIRAGMGEIERAETRLATALELNPYNRPALVMLGALKVDSEPALASEALERALDLGLGRAKRGEANALMARAQALQGNTAAAARHLAHAEKQSAPANLIAKARLAIEGETAQAVAKSR